MSALPLLLVVTLGAGKSTPLPTLEGPLGRFDRIVEHEGGRKTGNDVLARYVLDSCKEPVVLNLTTVVAGMGRVLQQVQEWLAKSPALETKLLGKKGQLVQRYQALMASAPLGSESCEALEPQGKLRVRSKAKFETPCSKTEAGSTTLGNYWFGAGETPLAFVSVQRAPKEIAKGCGLELATGVLGTRNDVELQVFVSPGKVSAKLTGRDCQVVEFTEETATRQVVAVQRSCKN